MFDAGIFPSGNSSLELNRTAKGTYTWSMKVYFPKADKHNLQLVIRRVVSCKNLLEQLLGQQIEMESVMPEDIDTPGFVPVTPADFMAGSGFVHGEHPPQSLSPQSLFDMFDQVLRRIDELFQMWEDIKNIGEYLLTLKEKVAEEKAKADAAAEEKEKKETGKRQRKYTKEKVEKNETGPAETPE